MKNIKLSEVGGRRPVLESCLDSEVVKLVIVELRGNRQRY